MGKPITFDVQRLIAEVASRHRLLLKPDDAAFAIVTMNRMVLEEALEAIHSRVLEDLALFQNAAKQSQIRAESALAAEVERSASGIRREISRDLEEARIQAFKIVQQVNDVYQKPMSEQKFMLVSMAVFLLIVLGIILGRLSEYWWPF
jgi:hypothetical protein